MTDITSTSTKSEAVIGNVKILIYETPTSAETSDTIDVDLDGGTNGISEIASVTMRQTAGADTTALQASWSATTGVITLPTINTAKHYVVVMGY